MDVKSCLTARSNIPYLAQHASASRMGTELSGGLVTVGLGVMHMHIFCRDTAGASALVVTDIRPALPSTVLASA